MDRYTSDGSGHGFYGIPVVSSRSLTHGVLAQVVADDARLHKAGLNLGLTDHCRVTVVAPNGMWADAISKAVGVLGPAKGLPLIDDIPRAAAMVLRAPSGQVERSQSSRWKDLSFETAASAQP